MKKHVRRLLSAMLSAVLLLSFLMPPLPALAAQAESVPEESTAASVPEETPIPTEEDPTETSGIPEENTEESSVPTEEPETATPAETTAPATEPDETTAPTEAPETTASAEETVGAALFAEEGPDLDWNLYFGQLHAHTDLSDGLGSVREAFSHASKAENLDFFAVTDHSDSFDNAEDGVISEDGGAVSEEWAQGRAAAAAVTDESFVGIFGYEMSWQERRRLGHLNTFGTPGFVSRDREEFAASLESYYQALADVPGSVSQFNHPGSQYGDFENFGHYSAEADAQICLLEVGGEEGFAGCKYYTRALDAGWHVAPTTSQNNHNGHWGDAREDRTVILAKELTEEALYKAMKARRVYATTDGDLTVYYELNGHVMGSILGDVEAPQVSVYLRDPTDETIGQVETIVDGGQVAASEWVEESEAQLTLHPTGGWSYYYLRITQPDGDVAVTAPVWTESFDDMGIAGFAADTRTPTQGEAMELSLALYNSENVNCEIQKLEFAANGEVIHSVDAAGAIRPMDSYHYAFPYTCPTMGTVDLQVKVTGEAAGESRVWREKLTLQVLPGELVKGILVDGSHGSQAQLGHFATLAADANMKVTVFSGQMPAGGEILLVGTPDRPFEAEFLSAAAKFVENGGSIILWGQADSRDGPVCTAAELNRLLEAVGSTMGLRCDSIRDEINHGKTPDQIYTANYNEEASWCADLTSAQVYAHLSGCTVDPGQGTWLVKAMDTAETGGGGQDRVLLAVENTRWGGQIFAAGASFLSDEAMPLPDSRWAAPRVGQSILGKLLNTERAQLPLSTIADLRKGEAGSVFRVRGYVTAGTSNAYNRFPETIYLQDDTGGIAVMPFREDGIQVGTPMEVTGYLKTENAMPVLKWVDYDLPDESYYRYVPKTVICKTAMDYGKNGGRLLQVEGTATTLTLTEDKKGVARLTVTDYLGGKAEVLIESCIGSGASGRNELAAEIREGRKVRVMGVLHLDEAGKPVLRVRNCDEVVYIPPRRFPPSDNPKTGDFVWVFGETSAVSLLGLVRILKKRQAG